MLNGLLLVDKREGQRSTDCVNWVRAALSSDKKLKVGHAGTLDSTASGLLILLAGAATRLSDIVMALPKVYRGVLHLGQATDTCDASGQVIFQGDCGEVRESDIDRLLPSFLGWRMQRPPNISAVKQKGTPAHKLARAGKEFSLEPRPVFFQSVQRISPLREGRVEVEVRCGKGTYIRSFARDLGERLGCGAFVESLRRISIGPFQVEVAVPISQEVQAAALPLLPPQEVAKCFHRIRLTDRAEKRLSHGYPVPFTEAGVSLPGMTVMGHEVFLEGARFLGLAGRSIKEGRVFLRPKVNIPFEDGVGQTGQAEGTSL